MSCEVVEDDGDFGFHDVPLAESKFARVAFVDGVRRADARLYQRDQDGHTIHGIAGAHGQGAVLCRPGQRPVFARVSTHHLVVWGARANARSCGSDGAQGRADSRNVGAI